MMTHAEANPDSFLYQNVDVLNVPNLPSASRPNSAIYGSPSIEQIAVELVEELQMAIHSGNVQIAMELAKSLASMRLSFRASREKNSEIRTTDQEISVRIHICNKDLASTENHIMMKLRPTMTVETLKLVMYQKHGYLPELQKWIAGRRLSHDGETLAEYGVNFSGAVMFLYLITPTDSRVQGLRIHDAVSGPASVLDAAVLQSPQQHELTVTSMSVVPSFTTMTPSSFTPPISILPQTRVIQPQTIQAVPLLSSSPEKIGWSCPQCTYVNLPTRPGCEMCASDRPVTYTTPFDYAATGHDVQLFPVSTEDSFDDVDAIISDSSS